MTKEETKQIAEDIQKIIFDSNATFFLNKDNKDIEIPTGEALYELKAEISRRIGLYFYEELKNLK